MTSRLKKDLRLAVIEGDGVGPEVIHEARKILDAVSKQGGPSIRYEAFPFSATEYLKSGRTLTADDLQRFRNDFDGILFGALGDSRVPDNRHAREILLGLRFELDLYVNFRPVWLLNERLSPLKGKTEKETHFVIFRENTEGLYRNIGGATKVGTSDEVAVETLLNTRKGVERILREACQYAVDQKLKRVCMVDKSNVLRFGHELWQRTYKEIQGDYRGLEFRHLYVDAAVMEMVRAPEQFDVIVTENLFGDVLSDLGAQLQGGMGMAGSINYNPKGTALFEPVHGSAPALAGKNQANPFAAILTVSLLLDYYGHSEAARTVEESVKEAIASGIATPDLGGKSTTSAVGDFVKAKLGTKTR